MYTGTAFCVCALRQRPQLLSIAIILVHFLCAQHVSEAEACSPDTTQADPHPTSNTQQTKNVTTNVVIQQHSRKLLMMDIEISETC